MFCLFRLRENDNLLSSTALSDDLRLVYGKSAWLPSFTNILLLFEMVFKFFAANKKLKREQNEMLEFIYSI